DYYCQVWDNNDLWVF
nr:immunoglobulin light chain junction region [Macaca mulatta]MOW36618.1 immunoglobulin light chain junction region [Macaca mulatta]MOW38401.1 immunoglobulin light chain junction region [Macaca mulatta]